MSEKHWDSGRLLARDTGFEPVAFGSGGGRALPAPARTQPQLPVTTASGDLGPPHLAHQTASSIPKFGATLGDASQAFNGVAELTVREVARRLRVSPATVYSICRRGEMEHHRVSNAIRIPQAALAKYLAAASTTRKTKSGDPERGS